MASGSSYEEQQLLQSFLSEQVRGLEAELAAELAQHIAEHSRRGLLDASKWSLIHCYINNIYIYCL